jgi:hypothetical protein
MTMDEMHLRTFDLIRVEVEALKERHFERGSVDLQRYYIRRHIMAAIQMGKLE